MQAHMRWVRKGSPKTRVAILEYCRLASRNASGSAKSIFSIACGQKNWGGHGELCYIPNRPSCMVHGSSKIHIGKVFTGYNLFTIVFPRRQQVVGKNVWILPWFTSLWPPGWKEGLYPAQRTGQHGL